MHYLVILIRIFCQLFIVKSHLLQPVAFIVGVDLLLLPWIEELISVEGI